MLFSAHKTSQDLICDAFVRSISTPIVWLFIGNGDILAKKMIAHLWKGLDSVDVFSEELLTIEIAQKLQQFLSTTPLSSPFKCVYLPNVHKYSDAVLASLLKSLEEPPVFVKFILTSASLLPAIITSRCITFDIAPSHVRPADQNLILCSEFSAALADFPRINKLTTWCLQDHTFDDYTPYIRALIDTIKHYVLQDLTLHRHASLAIWDKINDIRAWFFAGTIPGKPAITMLVGLLSPD